MSPVNSKRLIQEAAHRMGISPEDMRDFFGPGDHGVLRAGGLAVSRIHPAPMGRDVFWKAKSPSPGACTAARRQVAVLGAGALISESALLDETAHSTGAFDAPRGHRLADLPGEHRQLPQENPDIFYRIVARTARRISERLRTVSDRLAGVKTRADLIAGRANRARLPR